LLAHFTPEVVWDSGRQRSMIFFDARRTTGTRNYRHRGRMRERKLQRGSFEGHLVVPSDRLDPRDFGEDFRGRVLIFEVGAAGEDP
jgi:hypothetical protein